MIILSQTKLLLPKGLCNMYVYLTISKINSWFQRKKNSSVNPHESTEIPYKFVLFVVCTRYKVVHSSNPEITILCFSTCNTFYPSCSVQIALQCKCEFSQTLHLICSYYTRSRSRPRSRTRTRTDTRTLRVE